MTMVTVVVTAYNVERQINQCLNSIMNQTMQDFEVVVVDDASTDNTAQVLGAWSDPRIKVLRHDENFGPAQARNTGLHIAVGDWVAIIDGDDWVDPQYLFRLHQYAQTCQAQVVQSDITLVDECQPANSRRARWSEWNPSLKPLMERKVSLQDIIEREASVYQPFVSRQFLVDHGIYYDRSLRYAEDWVFLMDCAYYGATIRLLDDPLYFYRIGQTTSLTSDSLSVYRWQAWAAQQYLAFSRPNLTKKQRRALGKRLRQQRLLWFVRKSLDVVVPVRSWRTSSLDAYHTLSRKIASARQRMGGIK